MSKLLKLVGGDAETAVQGNGSNHGIERPD
jgi:hypothetical protein